MAKKNRSSENRSLYPVSERASRRALLRVVGNKATDAVLWDRCQQQTSENQPAIWNGLVIMADHKPRLSRIAESSVRIQGSSYMGGALIYLASVEEQARIFGRAIKRVDDGEVRSWLRKEVAQSLTPEDIRTIGTVMHNETSAEDLSRVTGSHLSEMLDAQEALVAKYSPSFNNSPLFDQASVPIVDIAKKALVASSVRMVKFLGEEPHFTSVMREWWWQDVAPDVGVSQMMGASDAHSMLTDAKVR
ncbi:MAG: hypothetical protein JWL85_190 [Candidatus Saccharibacteria bacterium]|nr:hypothetical protein [Candidatus Saccharibacteria bacterium]